MIEDEIRAVLAQIGACHVAWAVYVQRHPYVFRAWEWVPTDKPVTNVRPA